MSSRFANPLWCFKFNEQALKWLYSGSEAFEPIAVVAVSCPFPGDPVSRWPNRTYLPGSHWLFQLTVLGVLLSFPLRAPGSIPTKSGSRPNSQPVEQYQLSFWSKCDFQVSVQVFRCLQGFNRPRGKPLLVHGRKKSWYKCRWILSCLATENTEKWNHKIMRFSIRLEKGSQSRVYIWTKYFPEWPLQQRWLCWKQTTRSREFFPWFLGTWAPLAILVHLHGKQVLSSEAWLSTRFHCNTDTAC